MSDTASTAGAPIVLPERFAAGELEALKRVVDERRAGGSPVTFDASAVRAVDSAALQFLLVCRAARQSADGVPTLVDAGETMTRALADFGVTDPL